MEQKDSAERILKQIPYEIVYSARKTLAVQVKADGSVVVRAPKRMAKYKIEAFLKEKQDWIHPKTAPLLCKKQRAIRFIRFLFQFLLQDLQLLFSYTQFWLFPLLFLSL